jgi:hypothetical protein
MAMTPTACVLFLSAILPADSGPIDARTVGVRLTPEAERLLQIAEDWRRSYEERLKAVDQLGQRREVAVVPRLLRFLSGDADVLTLRVVYVLGKIGDRRALPALRKLRDDPDRDLPGKMYTYLHGAISTLEQPQGERRR